MDIIDMEEELTDSQRGMIDTLAVLFRVILAECDEPMIEKVIDKLLLQVGQKKED